MENTVEIPFRNAVRMYVSLTKPGIIFGNIVTAIAGLALAFRGQVDFLLLSMTIIGLSMVIGGACVFNNCIDRDIDGKMKRTQYRPLVLGTISLKEAVLFGFMLLFLGTAILSSFANILSAALALLGVFFYVGVYTFSKYYTTFGTLIGSISGALPPVVGYCAVSGEINSGAILLFSLLVFWQMPHFFAIAIYRLEDYISASIPVLPWKRGFLRTKIEMLIYVIGFALVVNLLVIFGFVGMSYFIVMNVLSIGWVGCSLAGFLIKDEVKWARLMFIFSLVVIMTFSIVVPISVL